MLLSLFFLFATGCGTTKSLVRKVLPAKGKLKKRVMVLPIIDQAGLGQERMAQLTELLVESLQKNERLLVQAAENPMPSRAKTRSPEFGIVIDPDIAKRAEELGMNVLVTGALNPFETKSKKSGIWPFRKMRREIEVSVVVNAVDITNGTLLLTNLESRKVKMPEPEDVFEEASWTGRVDDETLDKLLPRFVRDQASAIIEELKYQPWTGRLISTDGKTIIMNAGSDLGVTEGSIFEVFSKGEPIRSVTGRPLFLLGSKLGEIKVEKVMEPYSSAVPLTDEQFSAGQLIRLKE